MYKQLDYIEEPKLRFGFNQAAEDSRDGLTLFGPYESAKGIIRAGFIGTADGLNAYNAFVDRINRPIYTNSLGRPFFPGFKSVFGIEWPTAPTATIILGDDQIDSSLAISNLKERTYSIVSLYLDRIQNYINDEETAIDIWYVVVPNKVLSLCRPKSNSGKATYD